MLVKTGKLQYKKGLLFGFNTVLGITITSNKATSSSITVL